MAGLGAHNLSNLNWYTDTQSVQYLLMLLHNKVNKKELRYYVAGNDITKQHLVEASTAVLSYLTISY